MNVFDISSFLVLSVNVIASFFKIISKIISSYFNCEILSLILPILLINVFKTFSIVLSFFIEIKFLSSDILKLKLCSSIKKFLPFLFLKKKFILELSIISIFLSEIISKLIVDSFVMNLSLCLIFIFGLYCVLSTVLY
jgi:hypothetical protein